MTAVLGNNPYRIHQWVYDNIRFYPTYGMLRSAGIESRCRDGGDSGGAVDELDGRGKDDGGRAADSWAGRDTEYGLDERRQDCEGSFGACVGGGVKYYPERGAGRAGGVSEGDSWTPLDASFKQYAYTEKYIFGDHVYAGKRLSINSWLHRRGFYPKTKTLTDCAIKGNLPICVYVNQENSVMAYMDFLRESEIFCITKNGGENLSISQSS